MNKQHRFLPSLAYISAANRKSSQQKQVAAQILQTAGKMTAPERSPAGLRENHAGKECFCLLCWRWLF